MNRAVFAAATAVLGGLGAAGLMAAAPAQAACDTTTPPLTPQRVACVTNEQIGIFRNTADPAYQVDQFLFSATDDDGNQLGLVHQPDTFIKSVGDFLNGPRSPEDPTAP